MRTFGKIAPLFGVMLVAGLVMGPSGSRTAYGQDGISLTPSGQYYTAADNGAPNGIPAGPGGPGAMPPSFGPWPNISPFDHQFDQIENVNGTWWRNLISGARRNWNLDADFLMWNVRRPRPTLIGAPGIDPIFDDPDPTDTDPGVVTFGFARANNVAEGNVGPDDLRFDLIGHQRTYDRNLGIMLRWAYENPDGSGVEIRGWFLAENEWKFKRGTQTEVPDPVDPTDAAAVAELESLTRVTASLPLIDDTDDGTVVFYDLLYRTTMDTTAAGTGINYFLAPFVNHNNVRLRWFGGLQYIYIGERFNFFGIDSGMDVTFDDDGVPVPGTGTVVVDPYFGRLDANMSSHLFGPQIGVRYDVGGKNFKLWGVVALGVAVNNENLRIRGQGIGNGFEAFDQFLRFADGEDSTHASPTAEVSLNAEMNVLQFIPGIRNMKCFDNCRFIAGWSVLAAREVARPWDSIEWRGQPFTPRARIRRSEWYAMGWNFGIIGTY